MNADRPIGFFDSGSGGISVLAKALQELPHERFAYIGDHAHVPYGTHAHQEIVELSIRAIDMLMPLHPKALVIACNAATAAAVEAIRTRYAFPVIGMEPAVKPAVSKNKAGKVVVMATPSTLQEPRFHALVERLGAKEEVILLPCPGLVELVEAHAPSGQVQMLLKNLIAPLNLPSIETVVLGCTHFPFVREDIQHLFPQADIIDGTAGTIAQLKRVLDQSGLAADRLHASERLALYTTGDADYWIPKMKILLDRANLSNK